MKQRRNGEEKKEAYGRVKKRKERSKKQKDVSELMEREIGRRKGEWVVKHRESLVLWVCTG